MKQPEVQERLHPEGGCTAQRPGPALSLVVVTPDDYTTLKPIIRHIRAQTVRDRLEIVIVAPSMTGLELNEAELAEFFAFRVVEVGPIVSTAKARAAGIRAATASLVSLLEDHSFPGPEWAEVMIEAHREPWAAVGPMIDNANPASALSWAHLLIEYGPWLFLVSGGVVEHLPGHNSTYKRAVLLEYGQELDGMLEAETLLHWDLRARGYQLYVEPRARTFHMNYSVTLPSIPLRFYCGRLFAGHRARRWTLLRRAIYVGGAPLIPLIRLRRALGQLGRSTHGRGLLPRILPLLVLALTVDAAGEMVGYALGPGEAARKLAAIEFHRYRYLSKADRRLLNI